MIWIHERAVRNLLYLEEVPMLRFVLRQALEERRGGIKRVQRKGASIAARKSVDGLWTRVRDLREGGEWARHDAWGECNG